ncbi:SMP-30/gluconolactonase/LRE family protein [Schlesneria paludicola]|uniref:SMP-30/gluconolactonase/LRE family protein n=1 Tax=Schlesneria paludicola TaxID=360056 RepID=UPI00029AE89E|nr:SMP-30/gluconolactonase/LRE family protein [Schlesneria paludicola]
MPRLMLSCLILSALVCLPLHADEPKTISVGQSPESACRGFDNKLYVTMINGDVLGDGTVVVIDGDKATEFAKGLNAPKGIAFVGDYLVTADETTMWKIDKKGTVTKLADAKDFPNPIEFLNDVVASKDGSSVYVSDMSTPGPMFEADRKLWATDSPQGKDLPRKGCIYKVTLGGKVSVAVPAGNEKIRFPNGVTVDESEAQDHLYVGDFFSGEIVSYEAGKYTTVATGMRGIDGLTVTKDAFYASSWTQGKVWKVDRKTQELTVILDGLKSAADFYYDAKQKQLVVPDMLSGTLVFLPIK